MKGFGVCAWSLPLQGEELFRWLRDHGVQNVSVEFDAEACADDEGMRRWCARQKELAQRYGIAFSILALNVLCRYGMCHKENEPTVRRILERAIPTAVELGAPAIHMPSFVQGEIHSQEELEQTVVCLRYAAELGQRYSIAVGYESPLDEGGVRYVLEHVSGDTFFLLFDNENVSLRGIDPVQLYRSFAPHYRHTHLKSGSAKDAPLRPLAQEESFGGLVPLADAMRKGGFDGWVILESSYKKEPDRAVWEAVFEQDRDFVLRHFA